MSTLTYSMFPVSTWLSDHAPGPSEVPDVGGVTQYDVVVNTTTNLFYICLDPTTDAMVWEGLNTYSASGDAMLVLGTVTVSLPSLASNQVISLSAKTVGGTTGALYVSSKTSGTGFTIKSTSLLDTSTVHWQVSNT